jgi:hypothetical protein
MVLSTPGQVLSDVQINGRVTVHAADVTLRNVKIVADDYWVLMNYAKNLTVEDSTIIGTSRSQASIGDVNGGSFTGRRLDLSGAPDGVKMNAGSKLFDSYIHDLANFPGAHNDSVELNNAPGAQLVHNTILNQNSQTSAIMLNNNGKRAADILIADNLLAGGGYAFYGGAPDQPTAITFRNNAFSTRYFPSSGSYGPRAYWSPVGNVWSGNYWADGPKAGTALN